MLFVQLLLHFFYEVSMDTSIAIQILPLCEKYDDMLQIIDKVIDYIKNTGVTYEVSAFETTIEGEYNHLMSILKDVVLIADCNKVFVNVKIHYSKSNVTTIYEKVNKYR